jgi:hypothetical protein
MRISTLSLAVVALAVPAGAQTVPDWVTKTKISGLAFGDAYLVAAHHDSTVEDQNGLWMRRLYFTVDHTESQQLSLRFRLEGNSVGDFTALDRNINTFVKDIWLQWKYSGSHAAVIGLSSPPTFDFIESYWGYRHVEKTPLDLLRFAPSRDLGLAFKGAWGNRTKWWYHGMLSNGDDRNPGERIMGSLRVAPSEAWVIEAYGDYDNRTDETDVWTIQGFVGLKGGWGRAGAQVARQSRQVSATQDLKLDLFSAFVIIALNNDMSIIARVDALFDPNPQGDSIQFFNMSDIAEPLFFLAGVDIPIRDTFSIVPNIEVVSYSNAVGTAPTPDTDIFLKGTFYWTFN